MSVQAERTAEIKEEVRRLKKAELSRLEEELEAEASRLERDDDRMNPEIARLMSDETEIHFNRHQQQQQQQQQPELERGGSPLRVEYSLPNEAPR